MSGLDQTPLKVLKVVSNCSKNGTVIRIRRAMRTMTVTLT